MHAIRLAFCVLMKDKSYVNHGKAEKSVDSWSANGKTPPAAGEDCILASAQNPIENKSHVNQKIQLNVELLRNT